MVSWWRKGDHGNEGDDDRVEPNLDDSDTVAGPEAPDAEPPQQEVPNVPDKIADGPPSGDEPARPAPVANGPTVSAAEGARSEATAGAGETNGNGRARDAEHADVRDEGPSRPSRQGRSTNGSGKSSKKVQSASRGGGNGTPPILHERSDDSNFRDVLGKGLAMCRRSLVTVGIFSIVVNLLLLSIPIYLFQIADRVLTSRSTDTLVMLTGVVIGALGVHVILDMMRRFILMRVATEMESKLGGPVLSAAIRSSTGSSNRQFQALLDLQQLRSFVTGPVMLTFFDAPVAPVYFLAVFLIHPDLGFLLTASGVGLFFIALVNQKLTAVPFARAGAHSMSANLQADAFARSAQAINAMGMLKESVLLWGRDTAESLKSQVSAQDRNIFMTGLSKFLRLSTQIAMLGWGAFLALGGELTGGMIIAASIIASRALAPIEGTIEGWRSFVHARNGYAHIKGLLQSSPLNLRRLRLPHPEGRLIVERVLFAPPPTKRIILNGITFSLEPGESLAIVGPSGTGKSTLARMLVGSLTPTAGSVRLDKMDLRNWDPRQFGETVGYLPQDVELFPGAIKTNIARLREDVSDESIFEAAELADVHEMISQLPQGYETQIAVDGSPLSGGQKQRVGLARAFFGDPRLVVLDEPNSNLDAPGEEALARALQRAKEKEITVITVTQRPALLKSVDKIMMLKEGRVQALGERNEIIANIAAANGIAPNGGRPPNGPAVTKQ